jgi:hypothetical protein
MDRYGNYDKSQQFEKGASRRLDKGYFYHIGIARR